MAVSVGKGLGSRIAAIAKLLAEAGIRAKVLAMPLSSVKPEDLEGVDVLMIVGTDSDVLKATHQAVTEALPILPVSPPGYSTFFASTDWEGLKDVAERLARGEYVLRPYTRIEAVVNGEAVARALNEVAVFPSRSASVMEYDLFVNKEFVWRDKADGVLIATPAGSTAYAFSVGGPIVMPHSKVLEVVPVNTVNPLRRALIIPEDAEVAITNISSRYVVEVIADGVERVKVREEVRVVKAPSPVTFVRLSEGLSDVIERKVRVVSGEVKDLPPSAKYVLKMLKVYGPASTKELLALTGLPERTVRHALSVLLRRGLVRRVTDLRDLRRRVYRAV